MITAVHCFVCNRKLTDPESQSLGIGPVCREAAGYAGLSADDRRKLLEAAALPDRDLRAGAIREVAAGIGGALLEAMPDWAVKAPVPGEPDPAPAPRVPVNFGDVDRFTEGMNEGQRAAFDLAMAVARGEHDGAKIVGYAGVGKSWLFARIADALTNGRRQDAVVLAPTGKAALRLRKEGLTGASTIHRWCYKPTIDPRSGEVRFPRAKPAVFPPGGVVLVDEGSMIGPDLAADLRWAAAQVGARIVVAGDGFQLPPVYTGRGVPPPSLLQAHVGPTAELTQIMRQKSDSVIPQAGEILRNGDADRALKVLHGDKAPMGIHRAIAAADKAVALGGVTIVHKNATRQIVNFGVRAARGLPADQITPGEPLLVLKNTYQIGTYNGETVIFDGWIIPPAVQGFEVRDRYNDAEAKLHFGLARVRVREGDPVAVVLCAENVWGEERSVYRIGGAALATGAHAWAKDHPGVREWDEYLKVWDEDMREYQTRKVPPPFLEANFGYAYTCHKMQGSQAPIVFVLLEPSTKIDLEEGRRWLYTAITRAERTAYVLPIPGNWAG